MLNTKLPIKYYVLFVVFSHYRKVAKSIAGPPAINAGGEVMGKVEKILGARHKLSGEQKKAAADTE